MKANLLLLSYIPVLHRGVIEFLERYNEAQKLFIIGEGFLEEIGYPEEIRRVPSSFMAEILIKIDVFSFMIYTINDPECFPLVGKVVASDDKVTRVFIEKAGIKNVDFDTTFLMWHKDNIFSRRDVHPDRISTESFDVETMLKAQKERQKSSDWWRRVGAMAVRDHAMILEAYNEHWPTEQTQYIEGDPRDFILPGQHPDVCSTLHSEKVLVAKAAEKGISLSGADIYVSCFPCGDCAKMIASAGFKRCFFTTGSSTLQGEENLKSRGVEIIQVKMQTERG